MLDITIGMSLINLTAKDSFSGMPLFLNEAGLKYFHSESISSPIIENAYQLLGRVSLNEGDLFTAVA